MGKWLVIFVSLAVSFCAGAFALDKGNCAYLLGQMNPDIPRFGGEAPTSPLQDMANKLLKYAARQSADNYQVAIPVDLKFNPQQPEQFGDGQKNAFATYGQLQTSPFTAVLKRPGNLSETPTLAVVFSRTMPGFDNIKEVEFSILGEIQRAVLDTDGSVVLPIDLSSLLWDRMTGARPVFFRPVGWNDWFTVQFPNPYLKTDELLAGMSPSIRNLPGGRSIIDPLGMNGSSDVQNDLKNINPAKAQDFQLARAERVHGVYIDSNGSTTLTSAGGVWTRYRVGFPFKIVYLAKDARDLEAEKREGIVSGTGPHYIGATAEIIVNSVGNEPLMTYYGVTAPESGPNGSKLAWGFTHQWVGTWLKPGEAFVTPQGQYHWHLNHLQHPIAAQVFTPPEVPSKQNFQGFPKDK